MATLPWCSNAGAPWRVADGWATQSCSALQLAVVAPGALLGVRDPVPGGHQVQLAGHDDLLGPERVAVQRLALEQPGDRLQTDVRVRGDIEAMGLVDRGGTHVIDEAPGANRAPGTPRERPAHTQGADSTLAALGDLDAVDRPERRCCRPPGRRRRR